MFLLYLIHFSDDPPLLAQLIVLIKNLNLAMIGIRTHNLSGNWFRLMVFNATFNNISLISALLVEEPGVPGQTHPGADPGGAPGAPPKIGKDLIFWRKIVICHTKYPTNFRASLRSAHFF